ncbi:MAG TPA: hypothetical protein VFX16_05495 [Pseudonocardiaceae bacterium]|nr:hypothetical protein [Pseudonocardiaceae bacterium]
MANHRAERGTPSWFDSPDASTTSDPEPPAPSPIWDGLETIRRAMPYWANDSAPLPGNQQVAWNQPSTLDTPAPVDPAWPAGYPSPHPWTPERLGYWVASKHPPSANPAEPCRCGVVFCEIRQQVGRVTWPDPR